MLLPLCLGLLVGLVIGALGGGGSVLTVPLLVFLVGLAPAEATTASLVIVGTSAVVASLRHARSGNTHWRTGLVLAATGVPTNVLGSHLNRDVDPQVLLLGFAGLLLIAAAGLLLRRTAMREGASPYGLAGITRLVAAGLGIGFLTGFFGVGGGFITVPVLVLLMGMSMVAAAGTSLMVISIGAVVALLSRAGHESFDWAVIAPFTTGSVVASVGGQALAQRLPVQALSRAFALLLVAVAGYVAVRSGSAPG